MRTLLFVLTIATAVIASQAQSGGSALIESFLRADCDSISLIAPLSRDKAVVHSAALAEGLELKSDQDTIRTYQSPLQSVMMVVSYDKDGLSKSVGMFVKYDTHKATFSTQLSLTQVMQRRAWSPAQSADTYIHTCPGFTYVATCQPTKTAAGWYLMLMIVKVAS